MGDRRLRAAYVTDTMVDVRMVVGLAERMDLTVVAPAALAGRVTTWWPDGAPPVEHVLLPGGRALFPARAAAWLARRGRGLDVAFALDDLSAALGANLGHLAGGPPVVLQLARLSEDYVRCQASVLPAWKHRPKLALTVALAAVNDRLAAAAGTTSEHDARVAGRRNRRAVALGAYGVDTDVFRPVCSRAEARARVGLPGEAPVVLYRSRIAPEKDPETFLRAVARLRAEGRSLTAVYKGGEADEFAARARRLGVDVVASGASPPEDLALWYVAADVAVQTSHVEGLGVSVLEALACGTPVVATAVGGLPEAVAHGWAGILVPPGDDAAVAVAVARLLDDPVEGARLGAHGREWVAERFEAERAFAGWVALAEEVAGR